MHISLARALKAGDRVRIPADVNYPEGVGTVQQDTDGLGSQQSFNGTTYVWVNVKRDGRDVEVWPSNRLGKI